MSKRLEYQKKFAAGRVVNLGCGDCPVDFGPDTVQVDLDEYNYKNFVKADLHHLPFLDNEFDTAVMGDVLEHCYDPVQALREAGRVARKVVATVFEEWRLPSLNAKELIAMQREDLKKQGFNTLMEYYRSLPSFRAGIVAITDDDITPHHPHIQQFNDETLRAAVKDAGLELVIFHKFPEGEVDGRIFYNWLVVAKKEGGEA